MSQDTTKLVAVFTVTLVGEPKKAAKGEKPVAPEPQEFKVAVALDAELLAVLYGNMAAGTRRAEAEHALHMEKTRQEMALSLKRDDREDEKFKAEMKRYDK